MSWILLERVLVAAFPESIGKYTGSFPKKTELEGLTC